MTRIAKSSKSSRRQPGRWLLADAKAKFSELVRLAHSEGPQHVTVHGREAVVLMTVEEFRRLKGEPTGADLIAAMRDSPHRDVSIESRRGAMPVRKVTL